MKQDDLLTQKLISMLILNPKLVLILFEFNHCTHLTVFQMPLFYSFLSIASLETGIVIIIVVLTLTNKRALKPKRHLSHPPSRSVFSVSPSLALWHIRTCTRKHIWGS